jgi:predicted transcriptional regulator
MQGPSAERSRSAPDLGGLLPRAVIGSTLYDMRSAVTIRLDPDLERLLDQLCKQTGRTRSELVRDALRRQLSLMRFERLRRRALPFAEARGYLTDEDVARDVS